MSNPIYYVKLVDCRETKESPLYTLACYKISVLPDRMILLSCFTTDPDEESFTDKTIPLGELGAILQGSISTTAASGGAFFMPKVQEWLLQQLPQASESVLKWLDQCGFVATNPKLISQASNTEKPPF